MSTEQRYCIISNESGHDYFCPVEREEEAMLMLEAIEEFWNRGSWDRPDELPPQEPDFIERIDGTFTFTNPRCG